MPHIDGPSRSISPQIPDSQTYVNVETVGFNTGYITITDTECLSFYIRNNSPDKFFVFNDLILTLNPKYLSEIKPVVDFVVVFGGGDPTTNIITTNLISSKTGLVTLTPSVVYTWNGVGTGVTGDTGNISGGALTMSDAYPNYKWFGITSIAPGSGLGGKFIKRKGTPDVILEALILGSWR